MPLIKAMVRKTQESAHLISEKRLVHKKGKIFLETFHVKPETGRETGKVKAERLKQVMEKLKAATTSLPKGTQVKFKPPNEAYHRTGTIVGASLADTHYQIQGKRTEAGT